MNCPICGAELPEGAEMCSECGTQIAAAPPGVGEQPGAEGAGVPQAVPQEAMGASEQAVEAPAPPQPSAGAPAPPARLLLKRAGALTGDTFPVGERAVIGRFDAETGPVDLDLGMLPEATYVSRKHVELWHSEAGQWMIRDLGSSNGTFVRRAGGQFERVTGDREVADGDEIALGNALFEFRTG